MGTEDADVMDCILFLSGKFCFIRRKGPLEFTLLSFNAGGCKNISL